MFSSILAENSLFKAVGDIFHPLFILIASILAGIYSVTHNYVAAIVILTVMIMALLTPLTVKSFRSMVSMQALQPGLQKIRTKYKSDREQLNQEMMKLYKENGVSPTGGCLPMFLQMPALIVLYDTIRGLANVVKKGTLLATGKLHCTIKVGCAVPRYLSKGSEMYKNLVKTPGVIKSLGLNLAAKPLSHHAHWFDYVPYVALVLVAVGLQYLQMSQTTKRNKRNANAPAMPQQMVMMQRFMPLIFAYIYLLVPAGVVIYMIVSSGIRVGTQDLMFRFGLVTFPGQKKTERKLGSTKDEKDQAALPSGGGTSNGNGTASTSTAVVGKAGNRATGSARNGPARNGNGNGSASGNGSGNGNGSGSRNGNRRAAAAPAEDPTPKAHPRSKSKRERKAR